MTYGKTTSNYIVESSFEPTLNGSGDYTDWGAKSNSYSDTSSWFNDSYSCSGY